MFYYSDDGLDQLVRSKQIGRLVCRIRYFKHSVNRFYILDSRLIFLYFREPDKILLHSAFF
jgi:hypothetical protein